MDLNAIELFLRVVECNSFSAAAEKTGVSTSSVSRKISELEASLNIQLLERTTRKLRLTEKGRIFFEQTHPAMQTLSAARLNLQDDSHETAGTLRISVPSGLEESLIIPFLADFQTQYPEVCLKVLATGSNLKFVEDGIDLALRVGELQDSCHIAHTLLEYTHILVASPEYIKLNTALKTPEDLTQHKTICATNWHNDARWFFTKNHRVSVFELNESLSLNHYAAMQLAAEKNMGIAELPSVNCKLAIEQGSLIPVLSNYSLRVYNQEKLKLSIIYSANRYNSLLIKIFKNFCIEYFKKYRLQATP
ncbi:Transcriptional regulator, LysR family [hydrothermal vent metagenome]|uniref:Transcriptional regulator, LysR family n=1 Tax=hydrothermal vent metagenome TaxID=652676 RepID=A0A3B0XRT7_9ZZZZ